MPFLGTTPTQGFVSSFPKQSFTPNGSTTVFTLTNPVATANDLEVFVGNVRQEPTTAYTAAGTTLTMSEAPASGLNFYVINKSFAQVTTTPPVNSISTDKIVNSAITDAKIATMASSKLTGALPAISGAALTGLVAGTDSFTVDKDGNQTISQNTWTKLTFNTEETDPNSRFNTSTYEFTAPAAGQYFFHGRAQINNLTSQNDYFYLRFYVNDAQPSGDATEAVTGGFATSAVNRTFLSVSGVLNLSANDEVSLYAYTNAGVRTIASQSSCFSGFRLA